ncbi:MAG: ATP-binding protein [Mycobacteriales bacterium]
MRCARYSWRSTRRTFVRPVSRPRSPTWSRRCRAVVSRPGSTCRRRWNCRRRPRRWSSRVAQEAIRNVANHAGARTAVLRLTVSSTCAVLTVTDDGQGFEPEAVADRPATGHLGLVVLRDIAADAGADLRLDSAPGQGTSVRLEVPLS